MSKLHEILTKGGGDTEERFKVLMEFYKSDRNINMKTDLKNDQIMPMAVLDFIHLSIKKDWKIDLGLGDLSRTIKQLLISRNRLGRSEAMMVLRGEEKKEEEIGAIRKFLGV